MLVLKLPVCARAGILGTKATPPITGRIESFIVTLASSTAVIEQATAISCSQLADASAREL